MCRLTYAIAQRKPCRARGQTPFDRASIVTYSTSIFFDPKTGFPSGHPVDKTKQSFLFIGGPLDGKRFDFKESDTDVRGFCPLGRDALYTQTRLTLGKDTFRFFVVVEDEREGVQNIAYAVKKLMDEYHQPARYSP